jgi:hypothetical protein
MSLYAQLFDNVGTYYQDSSPHQEILHSQTELVWRNRGYESSCCCHILSYVDLC